MPKEFLKLHIGWWMLAHVLEGHWNLSFYPDYKDLLSFIFASESGCLPNGSETQTCVPAPELRIGGHSAVLGLTLSLLMVVGAHSSTGGREPPGQTLLLESSCQTCGNKRTLPSSSEVLSQRPLALWLYGGLASRFVPPCPV